MWFSAACTLIDDDMRHHSGQFPCELVKRIRERDVKSRQNLEADKFSYSWDLSGEYLLKLKEVVTCSSRRGLFLTKILYSFVMRIPV